MYMFVRKHLLSQAKFPYSKKPFKCQLVTLGEQWTVRFFFFTNSRWLWIRGGREEGEEGGWNECGRGVFGGWRGQGWAVRLSADVQTWINCLPLWNLLQRKLEVTWGGEGEKEEEGKHTERPKRLIVLFIPALVISHTVALYPSSISSLPSFLYHPHSFSSPPNHFIIHSLYLFDLHCVTCHCRLPQCSYVGRSFTVLQEVSYLIVLLLFLWTSEVNTRLVLWSNFWYNVPDPRATG